MRSTHAIVITGMMALAAAGPALGAWGAPERASRGSEPAQSPDVAVNAAGDAAAAWVVGKPLAQRIVVSVRAAGGQWGPPQVISGNGRRAIDPQVAVDATGRVVVVWRQAMRMRTVRVRGVRKRQAVYVVRARDKMVSEFEWGAVTKLSSDRQKVGRPEVAIDSGGGAVATWHWGTGTPPGSRGYVGEVQLSQRMSDGAWTSAQRVSRASICTSVDDPRVAVGARGHAVVWWQCDLTGGRSTALSVSRGPGESFGPERELPFRTFGDVSADLVVSPGGRAVAVSTGSDGTLDWWRGDVGTTIALSGLPALGAGEKIDPQAGPAQVAINASRDALSTWIDRIDRPRAASIAADLGVSAPASLSGVSKTPSGAGVAVGEARRGVMAWIADGRVMASARGLDGTITPGIAISGSGVPPADPPAIGMDSSGAAVIFWTRVVKSRPVVERASAPPSLTSLPGRNG